jgi:hypothetical protein
VLRRSCSLLLSVSTLTVFRRLSSLASARSCSCLKGEGGERGGGGGRERGREGERVRESGREGGINREKGREGGRERGGREGVREREREGKREGEKCTRARRERRGGRVVSSSRYPYVIPVV